MALTKITKTGIGADAIDGNKLGDNSISEEHLDATAIIGHTELSETANDSDILLIYDASSGSLKKILKSNVALQNPIISSVSPTNVLTGDGTGNATFTITGIRFDATATAKLITTGGTEVNFDSVTRDSDTQITGVIAVSSLSNANEPYDVKVINGNGLANTLTDQININASPTFVTASGSLGSQIISTAGSFSVNATDPESAGNVTFELQSGSLPPGYSITNTAAEGGTAIISGTDSTTSSTTTFNFVLRAVDAASNTSSRSFSIQSRALVSESFTSSGTFSVPSGTTSADVLVVGGGGSGSQGAGAGGGGGAGGLVFFPSYPVTPGGTITVTVGCGGASSTTNVGNDGSDTVLGSPGDPGLSPTSSILTAKGGGGGGAGNCGQANGPTNTRPGGSGGGAGRDSGSRPGTPYGGVATQPTQPGNSGAYGFGNNGGSSQNSGWSGAGGGGGAGAAGATGFAQPASYSDLGGAGGAGKAYTIADGTTPVYYAGGGGGTGSSSSCGWGTGGQGGGGDAPRAYSSGAPSPNSGQSADPGDANKGGGGGGSGQGIPSGAGGKGIVIVRY